MKKASSSSTLVNHDNNKENDLMSDGDNSLKPVGSYFRNPDDAACCGSSGSGGGVPLDDDSFYTKYLSTDEINNTVTLQILNGDGTPSIHPDVVIQLPARPKTCKGYELDKNDVVVTTDNLNTVVNGYPVMVAGKCPSIADIIVDKHKHSIIHGEDNDDVVLSGSPFAVSVLSSTKIGLKDPIYTTVLSSDNVQIEKSNFTTVLSEVKSSILDCTHLLCAGGSSNAKGSSHSGIIGDAIIISKVDNSLATGVQNNIQSSDAVLVSGSNNKVVKCDDSIVGGNQVNADHFAAGIAVGESVDVKDSIGSLIVAVDSKVSVNHGAAIGKSISVFGEYNFAMGSELNISKDVKYSLQAGHAMNIKQGSSNNQIGYKNDLQVNDRCSQLGAGLSHSGGANCAQIGTDSTMKSTDGGFSFGTSIQLTEKYSHGYGLEASHDVALGMLFGGKENLIGFSGAKPIVPPNVPFGSSPDAIIKALVELGLFRN